jgi:hypothetical protein
VSPDDYTAAHAQQLAALLQQAIASKQRNVELKLISYTLPLTPLRSSTTANTTANSAANGSGSSTGASTSGASKGKGNARKTAAAAAAATAAAAAAATSAGSTVTKHYYAVDCHIPGLTDTAQQQQQVNGRPHAHTSNSSKAPQVDAVDMLLDDD